VCQSSRCAWLRTHIGSWHVSGSTEGGASWASWFLSENNTRAFCVPVGPSLEAIRKTAAHNDLPVDQITQVRVLDPYFYD
jgi:Protein of unknown function (DUF4242)